MKKLLVIVLTLCMILSLSACGNTDKKDNAANTNSGINSTIQGETNSETSDKKQDENKINLMYTFEDPSKPVVFDYPNLKCIEEGTSRIFKNSKYVMVYCRDSGNCDLKDIPNTLSEKFGRAVNTHIEGSFSTFNLTETKNIQINGIDVLLAKGSLVATYDSGNKINLPLCGYTFAKDEMIYELIAILSEETNDVNQKEMEQTIEAMINTLREDR